MWCAALAASITMADLVVSPRGRVPPFASLLYVLGVVAASSLLACGWCLTRRADRYVIATIALLLFCLVRLVIPRLNY